MKYLRSFETYVTGAISINIKGKDYTFTIKKSEGVYLMLDDEVYLRLDIETPDSKSLDGEEFFLSPKVPEEVVDELVSQGFIDKCSKESLAGDQKVQAYHLI